MVVRNASSGPNITAGRMRFALTNYRHGSARSGPRPEPGADSVRKAKQDGSKNSVSGRLPAKRRLRTCRFRPAVSLDFTGIAIPCQRCEFLSCRGTEQPLERQSRCLCQLPDR